MESGCHKQDPKWFRPYLFIRIVGVYLLVSKAIVILLAIDIYQMWGTTLPVVDTKVEFTGVYLVPMIGILLVWSLLSIIGSVKLFLLHKGGFWISLAAIFLTLIVFPSAFTLYLNFANNFSAALITTQTNYAISSLTIAADITMIPLLLISRKRVRWKSSNKSTA
ncbi:MAG: hypothetical protein HY223_04610 [Thaumarchaeota archaeon]|nr:hypothetical protein [Nitrososphaerota archaeon]